MLSHMGKMQVIIAAGGSGVRLGAGQPKPLANLLGKPIVFWTVKVFESCQWVDSIIIVAGKDFYEDVVAAVKDGGFQKVASIVEGGQTRVDSVMNGLNVLDKDTQFVAVHDAARPLVSLDDIESCAKAAVETGAAILAVKVKPTIKEVDGETMCVVKTLDRARLWDVQTPQIFKRDILVKAYDHEDVTVSDDAGLVEKLGVTIKVVEGSYRNIKITTPEDLVLASQLLTE